MEKKFGKVGNKIFEIWEVEKYLINNDVLVKTIYYDKKKNAYDSKEVQILTLKELAMTPHVEITTRDGNTFISLGRFMVMDDFGIFSWRGLSFYNEDLTLYSGEKESEIIKLTYNGETLWEREDVMSVVIIDSNGNKEEFKATDLIVENGKVTMNMIFDKGEN